jgi:TolB-like protein/Tfp pilus assembly protein PilF
MQIWSAEIKELETLFALIKGRFPELEKELVQLVETKDANVVLLYSRRCLEVIITDLCECELHRPRKTEPLKGIIDKLHHEEKIPSHIIASMQNLNTLSTFGAHPKEFDPEQVKPVLNNLTTIIKWYLKYRDARTISTPAAAEAAVAATAAERYESEVRTDPTEGSRISKKKLILLISGLALVVVIIIVALFLFDIIGGEKQTKELEKSIAVLPFINDSPDEENTYFINGIMDEVLNNLQKIKNLSVISRTSVEQYRDTDRPTLPEIAKKLEVNFIVEGSGQKYGNTIRLRVQLIDAVKDRHLWAESYEKEIQEPKDIFMIQSQIAQSIAMELKAIITPEEKQLIEKASTANLDAYYNYHRGKDEYSNYLLNDRNKDALNRAEAFFNKALEYDPSYAQIYTGLAMVYWDKHYDEEYFSKSFMDSVFILTNIALSYDDELAEAYSLKGDYYTVNTDYDKAIKEYEKTLEINPNYWQAYYGIGDLYYYHFRDFIKGIENMLMAAKLNHDPEERPGLLYNIARALAFIGFHDEAMDYRKEALKLNNDSLQFFYSMIRFEIYNENYAQAIRYLEKCLALDPGNYSYYRSLGDCYEMMGEKESANECFNKYIAGLNTMETTGIRTRHRVGYYYLMTGQPEKADEYFELQKKYCEESIELNRVYARDATAYYDLACIYAFRGDKESAYNNLLLYNDKIGENEFHPLVWYFKNDPFFESIRNEPEFQSIYHEIEAKYNNTHERVRKWLEGKGEL